MSISDMKYKFIIIITTGLSLFTSCGVKDKEPLEANIEIQSMSLEESILEYDSIIHSDPKFLDGVPDGNYLLTVYERNINDSVTRYSISFSLDTWLMEDEPTWLACVGGKHVVFYPSGNYHGVLSTDKRLHKEIARRYFPKEYKLLDEGKPLNVFVFNDSPSLVLTFCKGKFVTKKMSVGI